MIEIHFFATIFFGGFIFTDRAFLRRSFGKEKLEPLYNRALIPLAFAAALLLFSGAMMMRNELSYYVKAALGSATIAMFFLCGLLKDRLPKKVRFFYRLTVLLLLLATIIYGRLFNRLYNPFS
ncbi:MAG: hypothetical protein LBT81_03180 [Helicobacteraceae bacterium]|jgi:hypothetical protein|nr:hypothetical protein [Helicobacteraceae bacterium]